MQVKPLYLWFSSQQAPIVGVVEYRLASGELARATEVSDSPACPNQWEDSEYGGVPPAGDVTHSAPLGQSSFLLCPPLRVFSMGLAAKRLSVLEAL